MRIGILTYWWSQENYGQVLQAYALLHFLRSMGHDAFLIRYRPATHRISPIYWLKYIILYLLRPAHRQRHRTWRRINRIEREEARLHPRHFNDFRRNYLPATSHEYNARRLASNPPQADAYICGSDQIWANFDPIFFLQFGGKGVRRIAYAPSFGGHHCLTTRERHKVTAALRDFCFISSRERSGIEVLHELGFSEATIQPDPTLLLSADIFHKLAIPVTPVKRYLLLYLLGNETAVNVNEIYNFAEINNLEVRYVASQGRTDKFPKLYPTIEEWLGLIDGAAFVLTNSFHGTIFCLHFNRPFLTFPVKGALSSMNNRIYDLLERYNLRQRIYQGTLDRLFDPIDFSVFHAQRNKEENAVKETFKKILINPITREQALDSPK